jgi:hypothetical protein
MIHSVGELAEAAPEKLNPPGCTEGKSARLARGMPNVSSTGLKGERF